VDAVSGMPEANTSAARLEGVVRSHRFGVFAMLNDNWSWQRDRRSIDDFVYRVHVREFQKLGDLKKLQAEERGYLAFIERNGSTGRVVEYLRSMVDNREIEIRTLEASGRFPT
jgi:hypothetical protein